MKSLCIIRVNYPQEETMDFNIDRGEVEIRIRGTRDEFADLAEELSRWNANSQSPELRRLLGLLEEASH